MEKLGKQFEELKRVNGSNGLCLSNFGGIEIYYLSYSLLSRQLYAYLLAKKMGIIPHTHINQ